MLTNTSSYGLQCGLSKYVENKYNFNVGPYFYLESFCGICEFFCQC